MATHQLKELYIKRQFSVRPGVCSIFFSSISIRESGGGMRWRCVSRSNNDFNVQIYYYLMLFPLIR